MSTHLASLSSDLDKQHNKEQKHKQLFIQCLSNLLSLLFLESMILLVTILLSEGLTGTESMAARRESVTSWIWRGEHLLL